MFVAFKNKQDRDKTIQILHNKVTSIRIKEDLPANLRAPKNILVGLRWKLKQWNFQNVWVDKEYTQLHAGGTKILQILIDDGAMHYEWDEEWVTWQVFRMDTDVIEMFAQAEKMLADAS